MKMGLTDKIPSADNIKFWGVIALIIVGAQGYLWISSGMFEPYDIYATNTKTFSNEDANWNVVTTVYSVSEFGAASWHDGFLKMLRMTEYQGHEINVTLHFKDCALDMLYLIAISSYGTFLAGAAGDEGFQYYLPVNNWNEVETASYVILDAREEPAHNDVYVEIFKVPEKIANANWYLVCFYRHMAGYDFNGDWINPEASIIANITAVV